MGLITSIDRLSLNTGKNLDLLRTFYVPLVSRNLDSLSRLNVFGFNVTFRHGFFLFWPGTFRCGCFNLFIDNVCIGSGTLSHDDFI